MAVRQRIFNSTAPFSGSPQVEMKGSYPKYPTPDEEMKEQEEHKKHEMDFTDDFSPEIKQILTQGTAKQISEGSWKNSSFIAQAECETQDSQEFSPSCLERRFKPSSVNCFNSNSSSEHNNVACPTTAFSPEPRTSRAQLAPQRKVRKRQKRKEKKKEGRKRCLRQRHRVPSGVPEQESGISTVQLQGGHCYGEQLCSTVCSSTLQSSEVQDSGSPVYTRAVYSQDGGCPPPHWSTQVCARLSHLSSYGQDSDAGSSLSLEGDCTLALAGLRGSVSQGEPCYAGPFFKDVEKDVWAEEEELSKTDSAINEGIIFYNQNIQPVESEYREGREYISLEFVKGGSYGEIHRAKDVNTGFRFATKKIPLKSFTSEEVGAWSALKSSRVVELFGVVREGPYVVLLMDYKYGSLGQLIAERGRLPEDLTLHYHWQVLGALDYLVKKRLAHLDIKADNVLLSEDGKDTFLCDFGHAEWLDSRGHSLSGSKDMKGTETHMAPEVVKVLPRGAKADVWSSCCMALHMLNGRQPWTRYYTCRLYLKIANDPPPLREIPPDCRALTAEVLKAGLQKDPVKRACASSLRDKTARALKEVGGLTSPVRGPYVEPLGMMDEPPHSLQSLSSRVTSEEEQYSVEFGVNPMNPGRVNKESSDQCGHGEKKTDVEMWQQSSPVGQHTAHIRNEHYCKTSDVTTVSELASKLERDFYLSSLSQPHSAEIQEQLLSCLSNDYCCSNWEPWDKKDSGRWSITPGDELSSGVFSYNSQPEGQVLSMDWMGCTQPLPPPSCFEGVDVCIKDFNWKSIRIREARRVKVGHIATGISDQISERAFTLETQKGQLVPHDEEIQESGLQLCCVSAPDFSPHWRWRVRDGVLETR